MIEEKKNEIQNLSLQQVDFIDQLTNANEELMNLWLDNERLQNDLNTKKQTNQRTIRKEWFTIRREQEIQIVRLCEVIEKQDKRRNRRKE